MIYDFLTPISRVGTGSIKVDMAPEPVKGSGFVPLTIADQEFKTAPQIQNAIKQAAEHGIMGYTYPDSIYTDSVKSWMLRRHNWDCSNWKMLTTPGVVAALGLAVKALTEPNDGVIVQPPVYYPFYSAIKQNNRRIVENPLVFKDGRYEIDFDDLEQKASHPDVKMLLLCSPHNPVGRVWSKDELLTLCEICKKNKVFIVADEIHNDLILPGNTHTVLGALPDMDDNCMICTSVSKTFNLAGLNCSNIFIKNESVYERFNEIRQLQSLSHFPYFARVATIAAYNESESWVDELVQTIDENFKFLYSFIADNLPMLKPIKCEGTYLAWIDMRNLKLSDSELEELMLKHMLAFDEGYIFGTNGSGFERWNLAIPKSLLADALERLKAAVNSL